jgi:nitrate reductase molybdenum cofactor assembly chaperone NarJ/NarW
MRHDSSAPGAEASANSSRDAQHSELAPLLRSRRADLELLRRALARAGSPYEDVVAAVCAQLPRLSRRELSQVLAAWESGPPREEVGLEPFAPPDYLAGYRATP